MSKNEKLYRISSRETDSKKGLGEAIDISNSRLHYKAAVSSRKEYNF